MKSHILSLLALILIITGCSSVKENKRTAIGAGAGTAIGAGVGAIFGKEKGAIIGGVIGGGLGAYAGSRMDKQAKELEKIAETRRTDEGLITKLKSDITFNTGKAALKPEAKTNIAEMSAIMKKYPENVLTIKGFTDDTGTSKINEKLSRERADSVRRELASNGIPESSMSSMGLGPAYPIATNDSPVGRAQNRRVEIEIKVDESKIPKEKKK